MNFDNPVLNSPYAEPRWHYATDTSGNLNYEDIRPERRLFEPKLAVTPCLCKNRNKAVYLKLTIFRKNTDPISLPPTERSWQLA